MGQWPNQTRSEIAHQCDSVSSGAYTSVKSVALKIAPLMDGHEGSHFPAAFYPTVRGRADAQAHQFWLKRYEQRRPFWHPSKQCFKFKTEYLKWLF